MEAELDAFGSYFNDQSGVAVLNDLPNFLKFGDVTVRRNADEFEAGLPPFISFSTSYLELNSAVLRHTGKHVLASFTSRSLNWASGPRLPPRPLSASPGPSGPERLSLWISTSLVSDPDASHVSTYRGRRRRA